MAATAAHEEVQRLLRFLTKDARLPLGEAMPKIHSLRKLQLQTVEAIAHAQHSDLKVVFTDEKIMKQVVNAAKRVSNPNKRASARSRIAARPSDGLDAEDEEAALILPATDASEDRLAETLIETNRAPLFLAFALTLLGCTQTEQPLSSRLSLAQAVVSAGAQSKAKYIGLTTNATAEEDGWALGQPKIRLMGRDVPVMRRHMPAHMVDDSQQTVQADTPAPGSHNALWGIDLEALRKSNGPLIAGKDLKGHSGPPIHTPRAARNYLLKSMIVIDQHEVKGELSTTVRKPKKPIATEIAARKEEAAAMVLKAIDIVCQSWRHTLTPDELDRRAQQWYALVRPEVAQGPSGWGQRGQVALSQILKFKRTA